jgi:ArsR family transcriptional regulator
MLEHDMDISISLCHLEAMEEVLSPLRAIAEPTRLRLVALCAAGEWCVSDLTEILGQSQPRLSRHLKLLCEAGVLVRQAEGANAWFRLAQVGPGAALAAAALAALTEDHPQLAADRRRAAARAAERAREAHAAFQDNPAAWDEMRALDLPARAIEEALLARLPHGRLGRVLDIGCGTGRMMALLSPTADTVLGIDLSRQMLALARTRIAEQGLANCTVRQADMAAIPLPDASFDIVVLCMVLHYADEPAAVLAEAARLVAPGGAVAVIDLAPHARDDLIRRLAHTTPGLSTAAISRPLSAAGLTVSPPVTVGGALPVLIHLAAAPAAAAAASALVRAAPVP